MTAWLLVGAVVGCSAGTPVEPQGPVLRPALPYKGRAFVVDVSLVGRAIVVSARPEAPASGISASLLAGDAVQLVTSNYAASTVGQFTPGKIRVQFDVAISNRLASARLVTPTVPAPPAGVSGLFLFPFSTSALTTNGVSSGTGDVVLVEQGGGGSVTPSADWDGDGTPGSGTPFSFFADSACSAPLATGQASDCYRYKIFAAPLEAGATTAARTVGFDIDPTISNFRARLLLAADVQAPPAASGAIVGAVSSTARGPLAGVRVNIAGTAIGANTDASGGYAFADVAVGLVSLTLANLPTGCTDPGTIPVAVTSAAIVTANIVVACAP